MKVRLIQKLVNSLLLSKLCEDKKAKNFISVTPNHTRNSPSLPTYYPCNLLYHIVPLKAQIRPLRTSMGREVSRTETRFYSKECGCRGVGESWNGREQRRSPKFWRSPNGEIGVIFKKNDLPKLMQKKVRLQNVIANTIEKEKDAVRLKYVVAHPAVKLLEKNINKIYANEIFINDKGFNALKEFDGMAACPSTKQQSIYDEIEFLNIKQRMHIKRRIAKGSFNSTFYT
eukprot:TRINITY_DN7805_c0_g3_i2.p1 TRINITY_DN7805_c0_g3~~TRINITY_DN7805_c0_g3_i2.p1  ORF type:complete len:229 (-),score=71.37 TRINITY_DN7805_c0_g3_i2:1327-2013(-)